LLAFALTGQGRGGRTSAQATRPRAASACEGFLSRRASRFEPKGEPGLANGYPTTGGRIAVLLGELVPIFNGIFNETGLAARGRP
jgi:hypothetical protein